MGFCGTPGKIHPGIRKRASLSVDAAVVKTRNAPVHGEPGHNWSSFKDESRNDAEKVTGKGENIHYDGNIH